MGKTTSLLGTIRHGWAVWRLYSKAVDENHDKGGNAMLYYIVERLREASTWRGIVLLIGALGVAISPEQSAAFITFGLGLSGLIGTFTGDKK